MSPDALRLTQTKAGAVRIPVRVTTRGARSSIAGTLHGMLAVRLHAPPVDGRANEELVALLAAALGATRADVRLVAGHRARIKGLEVTGLTVDVVRGRLARAATEGRC